MFVAISKGMFYVDANHPVEKRRLKNAEVRMPVCRMPGIRDRQHFPGNVMHTDAFLVVHDFESLLPGELKPR